MHLFSAGRLSLEVVRQLTAIYPARNYLNICSPVAVPSTIPS